MKIRTRIHCLSTISWSTLVLVSFLGWYNATNSNEAFDKIDRELVPKLDMVLQLRVQANNMVRRMYEAGSKNTFAYREQVEELTRALEQKKQADEQSQQWFQTYDKLDRHPDAQAVWDKLRAKWPGWFAVMGTEITGSLETALRNPSQESLNVFYKKVDEVGVTQRGNTAEITGSLQELSEVVRKVTSEVVEEDKDNASTIRTFQIVVSLLAIAGVIFLGITTLRAVVRPIERVRDTTVRIAGENDLRMRVDYRASDEVGEMVEAYNGMLGKLQVSFQDITGRVREVNEAVNNFSTAAQQVAASSASQSSSTSAMAASVEEMTVSINT
ncbi:MAG: HAMP domain-containing protein, partial [Zoogloeaceae bacterium]|nr:HAMP domain-containing protein [Zoogloeaceae bacterium]